ncbi:unnamed protein product [uncultured bacterium]|nr:unnamed protein product [uncultured bacterium]
MGGPFQKCAGRGWHSPLDDGSLYRSKLRPSRSGRRSQGLSVVRYGEAVAGGSAIARAGLMEVFADGAPVEWKRFARDYRKLLFSEGEQRRADAGERVRNGISSERVQSVLEEGGELSLGELVRCRVRYFADGLVFGSVAFVERAFERNREKFGRRRRNGARKLLGGEYQGMRTLRDLKVQPIGAF